MNASGQPIPKSEWHRQRPCSWVVRWFGGDMERYSKSFLNRKEAERFAEAKQIDVRQGRGDPPAKMTLRTFAAEHRELAGGSGSRSTLLMQIAVLKQLAKRVGWDRNIQQITSRDIELFRADRSKDALSIATVNKEVKSLKRLFNLAIKRGYLRPDANPCIGVALAKVGNKRPAYLSPAKFERVYAQANCLNHRTFLVLLYTTGLRRDEALNLTWDDIDFERAVLHVARREASGYVQEWTPKDHERRELPVPKQTLDLLEELKGAAPPRCPYVFMDEARWVYFKNRVDQKLFKPETSDLVNNVLRKFKTLCKRAEVGQFTLHDLRRSCITNWARQGLPIHVAQQLAGHADIKTTQTFYLSVQEEDLEKARSVQQELVSGLTDIELTDQKVTISVQARSFPKRRIFFDGTQLQKGNDVA